MKKKKGSRDGKGKSHMISGGPLSVTCSEQECRKIAMAISGHKTRSVFDRYNIVNESDLEQVAKSLSAYFEREKVTLSVTLAELKKESSSSVNAELVGTSAGVMELARGIEPPTGGLQNHCSAD